MIEIIDQKQVLARLDDWEKRIRNLFDEIRRYYGDLPTASFQNILEGSVLQTSEEPIERLGIPPRMLPTLSVLYGKNRVSFMPQALWMIAANGRINIITNRHHYILVDLAEYGSKAHWCIVTSRVEMIHRDFDFEIFHALVEGREIE